jgi:hypothetical protein
LDADDPWINEDDILERVDEYTLYCHYLGFEPQLGMKYTSPIRVRADQYDDFASFGMFTSRTKKCVEYMWKDQGLGIHGDIFDLVRHLFPEITTRQDSVDKIAADFGIINGSRTYERIPVIIPQPKKEFAIRVKSRPFDERDMLYWRSYNINKDILEYYHVSAILAYWTEKTQKEPRFPRKPGYAYRIWDRYKLYFPYDAKDFKFRNNFDERHLEGMCQLRFNSDLLVITKALKDVMFFRSLGIESVAPRGEHTMIEHEFMQLFQARYKHILVLMDNDGKNKAPEYKARYGIPYTQIPLSTGEKDPTDHCKVYGAERTEILITNLVYESLGIGSFVRSYL